LLTILKNRDGRHSAVPYDERPMMQKQMQSVENENLEFVLFEWFCYEKSVAILVDGPLIQTKVSQPFQSKRWVITHKSEGQLSCFL
jgi:hypothetical protein